MSSPRFRDVELRSGVRLHVAEQGRADGLPVVLLHGITDSWFSFSRVLPLFPPEWRAIAPDQRGHGNSDKPASGYEVDDFASDVVDLMDALSVERAVLVGHSMGSFVARRAAALAPERATSLVLVGPSATFENAGTTELREALAKLDDPLPVEFVREFQLSTLHRDVPPEFLDRVIAESMKAPARVWKAALEGLFRAEWPSSEPISCPVTIIAGEYDAIFPPPFTDALIERIPHARRTIGADIGHTPHWEAPQDFVRDLAASIAA
jgi:pimeloyl-ACP methyl ester carboxylesterase